MTKSYPRKITAIAIAFFLFAAVLSVAPFAQAEDALSIVSRLQGKYESITTLTADFTQEIFQKAFNKPQVSGGRVFFKKPGKMRWLYSLPAGDELVSDGTSIWVFQPDLNQVIESPVNRAASTIATDFLSGVGNLKKDFEVTLEDSKGGAYRLGLTPKSRQANVKSLSLEIDKTSLLVVKTVVEDTFGNETRVLFKNIKVNRDIKDSFFEFIVPKGAAVVRP